MSAEDLKALPVHVHRFILALLLACASAVPALAASSGPLGLDHRLSFDDSGLWSDSNLKAVEFGSALLVLGGALYEGNESRLGRTFWKTVDAMLLGDVSAAAGKAIFRRQRPIDGNDPDAFFRAGGNNSFPSGEMTHIAAIVTPFIMEYHKELPSVWLLAVLPVYVGAAKLKTQAHWQTDILAGAALGVGVGYFVSQRDSAWSAHILPAGFSVGYKKSF